MKRHIYFYLFAALDSDKKAVNLKRESGLQATPLTHQIGVLIRRGFIMCKRDVVSITKLQNYNC